MQNADHHRSIMHRVLPNFKPTKKKTFSNYRKIFCSFHGDNWNRSMQKVFAFAMLSMQKLIRTFLQMDLLESSAIKLYSESNTANASCIKLKFIDVLKFAGRIQLDISYDAVCFAFHDWNNAFRMTAVIINGLYISFTPTCSLYRKSLCIFTVNIHFATHIQMELVGCWSIWAICTKCHNDFPTTH